jgi:hypothetical protein
VDTTFSFTWFTDTVQVEKETTTLPAIATSQNGSGAANSREQVFDIYGNPIWTKDERGFITRSVPDIVKGGVTQMIGVGVRRGSELAGRVEREVHRVDDGLAILPGLGCGAVEVVQRELNHAPVAVGALLEVAGRVVLERAGSAKLIRLGGHAIQAVVSPRRLVADRIEQAQHVADRVVAEGGRRPRGGSKGTF